MKFSLFGIEIRIGKQELELYEAGAKAKRKKSWEKIKKALDEIEAKQIRYSEYRVQQLSGVSINTVKKYRSEIAEYREQTKRTLL